VKSTFHKLLVLCCALYLSGAHWMVLQTTAWTCMLLSRSVNNSLTEAVKSTFDGQHPCPMCSAIADGKQSEKRSQKEFDVLKKIGDVKFLDCLAVTVHQRLVEGVNVWPQISVDCVVRAEAPPTPPPLA